MFFFLSKILHFLVSPLSWIIILFILGLLRNKKRNSFFMAGIILLFIFTNPLLANYTMKWWEVPSRNSKTIKTAYDGGIVLGGAMRYYNTLMERPVYGSSIDRVIQAVSLYREGKIKKIILSGGSGLILLQDQKESILINDLLLKMGIPATDILFESESRNTYENAIHSIALLKEKQLQGKFLLITSAYHMRRSLDCFAKAGFALEPYSVDEHSGIKQFTPDKLIIPDSEILEAWDLLIHEWIGYVTYKLMGYA